MQLFIENVFILHSTINHHVAYCNAENGSQFTNTLCRVIKNYHQKSLHQLTVKINKEMEKLKISRNNQQAVQISNVGHTLSYEVQFHKAK